MKELTELVIRYKELKAELNDLRESYDFCIDSLLQMKDDLHIAEDYFLQHVSSFSVCARPSKDYPFQLSTLIEGVKVVCIVEELPKGCEL